MKVEMLFYSTNPSKENIGMKLVLWEVLIEKPEQEPDIQHDWGFAHWNGTEWDSPGQLPEGMTAVVCRWANTLNPEVLLKEPSKIIKL